jgi:hypothetical protein
MAAAVYAGVDKQVILGWENIEDLDQNNQIFNHNDSNDKVY